MKRAGIRFILGVSGALLLFIGASVLFQPHQFFAGNGVTLGNDPSLMSEIRAPGGLLIGSAIVMLVGVFRQAITRHALFLAMLVYGSYGISRLFSMAVDGMPSSSLTGAMIAEIVIAVLAAVSMKGLETTVEPSTRHQVATQH